MIRPTMFDPKRLAPELVFSTSRSSGPGGQNVNKVNSKVTLKFDVKNSILLNKDERQILSDKLKSKLTNEGVLILSAQEKRSQLQNKELVINNFEKIIGKCFVKRKSRRPTKPSKNSIQARITEKKQRSEKKQWRQKP